MQPGAIVEPSVAMVSTSHIVQDKAIEITYMDTDHQFWWGEWPFRSSCPVAQTPRLIIEDVIDLP